MIYQGTKSGKAFMYGMRLRPFAPGCQPMKGLVVVEDDDTGKYWNILGYEKQLSDEDLKAFELDYLGEGRLAYD